MCVLLILLLVFSSVNAQIINPIVPGSSRQMTTSQCRMKPADIIFVLDDSGSVGYNNFKTELQFLQAFAKEFVIGPLNVQIGVITYSSFVHEYIRLNSNRNEQSLISNIMRLPYQSGLTRTADAINLTLHAGFSQAHGDRDSVTDVMMVITDGQSQDPRATAEAAQRAHDTGIVTFAIGVGSRLKAQEMDNIASDKNYVFHVSNYDALQQLKEELRNKTCEAIAYSNLYCQNNIKNCNSYGHVVCVNYTLWARQNCPLYCGYCAAQGTPPPATSSTTPTPFTAQSTSPPLTTSTTVSTTSATTTTPTTQAQSTSAPLTTSATTPISSRPSTFANTQASTPPPLLSNGICRDEFGNCIAYGLSVCNNYRVWSIQNCAYFCGFCHGPATPPPLFHGKCIDNLSNGTCESYGPDICFKYREWAMKKCPKFCAFCEVPTMEPPCINVDVNCQTIGPVVCFQNRTWAVRNCREFCGFCSRATTSVPSRDVSTQGVFRDSRTCSSSPSDVVVLLDTTFDTVDDFKLQKSFLYTFVDSLDYGDRKVQIGVAIPYAPSTNESRIFLNQYHTKADILAKINLLPYQVNRINSTQEIVQVINEMFSTSNGNRQHVPNIVVMITDGRNGHYQKYITQGLQRNDVTTLAVGVGQNASDSQLQYFVTQKSDAFHVNTIDDIMDISDAFKRQYCEIITRTCADDSKSICHDHSVCSIQTSQMMCRSTCKLC